MSVANYSREDIVQWMELLRTQYQDGSSLRLLKLWHTEFPSIQGPWTPFTFKEPSLAQAQYPDVNMSPLFKRLHYASYFSYTLYILINFQRKLGAPIKVGTTATEELLKLYKQQQESENVTEEKKVQENVN